MALPLLLEPSELEARLGDPDLLIVDLSQAENHRKHHVPGAVHLPFARIQRGEKPAPGKLPSAEQLSAVFSAIGLTANKHVVAYDDEGGGWAGRLIWVLDCIGHHRYSYLNGGLHSWVNEGHPTESGDQTPKPSEFGAEIDTTPIAELADTLEAIEASDSAIWDARSREEYEGSKVVAARGGHIPGAINIDWLELMDRQRNLRLIDLAGLQSRLDTLGLTKDKTIITHCQTHHRSGLSYLAMKILGYPRIKGYHGSWSEWGNREDTPVTTGPTP